MRLPRQWRRAGSAGEGLFSTERADGQVEVYAGNRVCRENEGPAYFLVIEKVELLGQYGSPNKTLADRDLRNHHPGNGDHPLSMLDIEQAKDVKQQKR